MKPRWLNSWHYSKLKWLVPQIWRLHLLRPKSLPLLLLLSLCLQAPPPIQNLPNQTPPISQMANPTPTPISKGVSPTPLTINVLSSEKTAGMPTKNGGGEDESHPGSRPVWEQWIFKFVPLSQYVHSKKFKMLELDKYDGTDFSGELKRGGLDVVHWSRGKECFLMG